MDIVAKMHMGSLENSLPGCPMSGNNAHIFYNGTKLSHLDLEHMYELTYQPIVLDKWEKSHDIPLQALVTTGEVVEVGAAAMTKIPMAEPCPCKLARVKSIKSNNVRQ